MTDLRILRCLGCGVPNGAHRRECASCGTLLAGAPDATAVAIPAPDAEAHPSSLRGVGWLFAASVGLSATAMICAKLDVDGARLDVAFTVVDALIAVVCVVVGRAALAPLLATAGGWRGLAYAVGGFGFLVAFGALYFRSFTLFGVPTLDVTEAYVEAGWPTWSMYLLVSIAPAIIEEATFRGYAMSRLEGLLTPGEALVVQAALFAVLHFGPLIFPSHFVIGLVLGIVRRRTRSLYPSMAVHMAWNGMIVWSELLGRTFP